MTDCGFSGSSVDLPVSYRNTEKEKAKQFHDIPWLTSTMFLLQQKQSGFPGKHLSPCDSCTKRMAHLHSERVKKPTVSVKGETYSGWKITTSLEFLQGHGAGISAKKEDERHEGDVRDISTVVAHKVSPVFQALLLCQRRPVNGGVVLQKKEHFHEAMLT